MYKILRPHLHLSKQTLKSVVRANGESTLTISKELLAVEMAKPVRSVRGLAMPINTKGEFVRSPSSFRNWITADGSSGFPAEANRYHLYVSLACPWASRTLMARKLKGLENVISFTVVDWLMLEGWLGFTDSKPKCSLDTVNNCKKLREVYKLANSEYSGRITVPVLWDKTKSTIVNNESSEILRMLNSEFNEFCATEEQKKLDLYPQNLRTQIEELNGWIYTSINNGVYRAGFAQTQEAYDKAVGELFEGLDKVEDILSKSRYLTGSTLTEADVRLFVTLVRFDMVYVGHFKCNKKRIVNYPNMWGFVRDIYQTDGIAETVDPEHIQKHYQMSHKNINPFGIVAIGPADLDFTAPHGRETMGSLKQTSHVRAEGGRRRHWVSQTAHVTRTAELLVPV